MLGTATRDVFDQLAALIGGAAAFQLVGSPQNTITGDGAIPLVPGLNLLTKGSAAAITIAAPPTTGPFATPGALVITIEAGSAFAHVVTFTGNTLRGGTAAVATATSAAQKGASITISNLTTTEWYVIANNAFTLA